MPPNYVLGIIVTYHPKISSISNLLDTLAVQVDGLLLIDNASPNFPYRELERKYSDLKIFRNNENIGLAAAYNQGIAEARARSATHIILFDQDSLPAPNMVDCLRRELLLRNTNSLTTAVAGPRYTDIKGQNISPFVRIKGFRLERVRCTDNEVVEIDHLISSGSLIDMRAIDLIGEFSDELFIDCVDTEWCLRARHHNLIILGVGSAAMQHNIGDDYLTIMSKQLPLHSPVRLYYQFRNQIWLIKQPWTTWRWRTIDTIRCIKLFFVFILFAPNKRNNLLFISKGIFDGLRSRMGRIENKTS